MSASGDMRKFFAKLRRAGVEIDMGHGHHVLRYEGRVVGVTSNRVVPRRAHRNLLAQLRRAGVNLDADGRREAR